MSGRYFVPEQRAQKVHELFTRIARRYDLINDIQSFGLHRWWKRKLLRLGAVQPGERVLDVCSGTGDVAFLFAARGARVAGLDFTEAMLLEGERRKGTLGEIAFIRGDALRMPFADGSFDIVTISYGLRNLADFEQGLAELQRVTKPGGRILILDFGKPANRIWRALYFCYLRMVVPVFGLVFCGDAAAYAYILESLQHYPAQHGVDAALKRSGCQDVQLFNFLGGVMSINHARRA